MNEQSLKPVMNLSITLFKKSTLFKRSNDIMHDPLKETCTCHINPWRWLAYLRGLLLPELEQNFPSFLVRSLIL
jgi:hypothetical protein